MTNLGGSGFFFLVYGLLILAGTPVLVAAWLGLVRYLDLDLVRAFAVVNGGMFVVGLVLVTLWSMPLLLEEFTPETLEYLGIYVGTAIGVIVLVEIIPLGLGILSTERYAAADRTAAAYAAGAGWFLGAILGLVLAALVAPGFLAVLGVFPGGIIGAVVGGPPIHMRFGRRAAAA
ncbi:MAG: hypothetical protein ABEJ58_05760 [Halodesulfurarchaeum sp.]